MALRRPKPNSSLTAAAAPLVTTKREEQPRYEDWQDEAWYMFRNLGEYRQGVTWLGNILSRIRLTAAFAPEQPGDEPQLILDEDDPAVALVRGIASGIGGQSELLRSAAVHLTVPGEGWFVAETDSVKTSWKFYSANEIRTTTVDGTKVYQVQVRNGEWKDLPNEVLPIRVWRPDDRYHWKAASSTQAALPIMRRLELMNRHIDATSQSRLSSNGMYWIPSEMVFPVKPEFADQPDPFIAELIDLGKLSIQTPGSAAAALPFYLRAPAEYIEKLRHDTFSTPYDEELLALRESEIRRLATALDFPPEVLLGLSGVNHWTAWQIEESALKTTISSLMELVSWALTEGYLQPALTGIEDLRQLGPEELSDPDAFADDARQRIVWFDLSELSVRPDRSQDAITLSDKLLINDDATLRETGFADMDKLVPGSPEMQVAVGRKLLQNPATVAVALDLLGVKADPKLLEALIPQPTPQAPAEPKSNGATPITRNAEPPASDSDSAPPSVPAPRV